MFRGAPLSYDKIDGFAEHGQTVSDAFLARYFIDDMNHDCKGGRIAVEDTYVSSLGSGGTRNQGLPRQYLQQLQADVPVFRRAVIPLVATGVDPA